jgi:hypothetical protein
MAKHKIQAQWSPNLSVEAVLGRAELPAPLERIRAMTTARKILKTYRLIREDRNSADGRFEASI